MAYLQFDKSKPLDAIMLGRATIDLNPLDYFKPLSLSSDFRKYVGGSPANIAVGLSRLGGKSGFIGKVSDDRFGDYVVDFFQSENVNTEGVVRAKNGEKLGLTFTEILSRDESSILMYRDGVADLALSECEVDENYVAKAKVLLVSGTALSTSPSREAVKKAVKAAKAAGTVVVFDIDYRPYTWKSAEEIAVNYAEIAHQADMIMGSREEYDLTEALIEKGRTDEQTAAYWLGCGSKIVIIKHGKQGSTAHTADGAFSIKPFPVEAFKSFGGGDGYGSALLYALLNGYELIDALEFGSASASMLVSAHGCSKFMPTLSELKAFIADEKSKYGEMIARN